MDIDYSKYFVDAQGDITGIGSANSDGVPKLTLPKEADIRFRNFTFPSSKMVPLVQAVSQTYTVSYIPPVGWQQTMKQLMNDST